MTTKTTKTKAATGDLLDGIPDAPAESVPCGFEVWSAWGRGLKELKTDQADDSGPAKAYRLVRQYEHAVHLVGGSVHNIRPRLEAARHQRMQIVGRIGGLERSGNHAAVDVARRDLEAVDKNIATLTAQVDVLEAWPGPGNVVLRQRLEQAVRRHEEQVERLKPYREHREFPVPDGWEREPLLAEQALHLADASWNEGRARLDKLGIELRKATTAAYDALAGALGHVEDRLGQACAKIVTDSEPEFLIAFPNRAPDDLIGFHQRAERVSGIMGEPGAGHDAGLRRFWGACGEVAAEIVSAKVGAGRSVTRERPRGPISAAIDSNLPPSLRES